MTHTTWLEQATQRHERLAERRAGGDMSHKTFTRLQEALNERMAAERAEGRVTDG